MAKQIQLHPIRRVAKKVKRSVPYVRGLADLEIIDSYRCGSWRALGPNAEAQIHEYERRRKAEREEQQ